MNSFGRLAELRRNPPPHNSSRRTFGDAYVIDNRVSRCSLPYRRIRRIKIVHRTFQNGVQDFPNLAQDFLNFAQDFPNFAAHLGGGCATSACGVASCFEALVDIHGWRRSGAGSPPATRRAIKAKDEVAGHYK